MKRVRDWIVSIPTAIVFGVVLCLGDLLQRITFRMGPRRYDHAIGVIHHWLIRTFAIAGARVEVEHRDRLAPSGGYVIISNHQSMFDIPLFGGTLSNHTPRFVSKRSLAKGIPTVSLYLKRGGNALIDRGNRTQAMDAIAAMGAFCQDRDVAAVIFPEGTRSRDGSLGEYRLAGAAALIESAPELPIVPAVLDGSWRLFENNLFPIPYGVTVRMRFGTPIARTTDEDPEAILELCRAFAEETLAEWHRGQQPAH